MKDNNLDNIDKLAKKAFEDFEVPYDPMDWAAFQHQLKDESTIDQVAKNALEDYQVELPNNSWEQFETLLSHKRRSYRYIWWLKAAEVSAMALLLLGLTQWLPCPPSSSSTIAYDATSTPALTHTDNTLSPVANPADNSTLTTTNAPTSTPLLTDATTATPNEHSAQATADLGTASSDQQPPQGPTAYGAPDHAAAPHYTTAALNGTSTNDHEGTETSDGTTVPTYSNKQATTPTRGAENASPSFSTTIEKTSTLVSTEADITSESTATTTLENSATSTASTSTVNAEATPLQETSTTALLAPAIWSNTLTPTEPIVEIRKALIKAPFQPQHYWGARLGVGANTATSMGNTSIGYSAGLTYEREFTERWAIATGLGTSLKRFNRNDLLEIKDKDGQSYQVNQSKTTHLVVMEIPVDVQYTLFRSDKWRLYLAAGVSLNAVASRTYDGTQEIENDGLSFSLDLNSSNFERGLFEGGSFLRNAYLSVGGGVGIERQLGNSLSLYLLPTYRHAVTPAGDDHLHTFNVNIGLKSPLSVKKR